MPFTIVQQDITTMKVDAIVNAANTELRMGGGVCGAIFQAAGAKQLQAACSKVSPIQTGGAAVPGIYGYPKDEALEVARQSIQEFLQDHDMDIYLALFDKSSF